MRSLESPGKRVRIRATTHAPPSLGYPRCWQGRRALRLVTKAPRSRPDVYHVLPDIAANREGDSSGRLWIGELGG